MTIAKTQIESALNRILISRFISGIGDWGGLIAISNLSYSSTHSVRSLSLLYATKISALLFSSVFQKIYYKKLPGSIPIGKLLAILDLISAISLFCILKVNGINTAMLSSLYFLASVCTAIFFSITNSLITEINPDFYKENLRLVLLSKRAAFLIGPIIMGSIIGKWGNQYGILADALSFLISGVVLFKIATTTSDLASSQISDDEYHSGLFDTQMTKKQLILPTALTVLVGLAGGAANAIELPYIVTQLKLGSNFFGFSLALGGLGAIIGILLDGKISNKLDLSKLISTTMFCLVLSFLPWYLNSIFLFSFSLILFGISVTIFSNRILFHFVDAYNNSDSIRQYFKNKPSLFLFYHQVDSISMILGSILAGIVADQYSTYESIHFIVICLFIAAFTNFIFGNL